MNLNKLMPGKQNLLILLIAGILLVVIAMPVKEKEENIVTESRYEEKEERGQGYEEGVEKKLSKLLSNVKGVGKNTVMITLKSTAEKVVEKDKETNEESMRETTVFGETGDEASPYVKKEMTPKIEGVIIIAEGGDDPVVVKNITEAVQALFDVDTHKIKVMKRNQTN